MLNRSLAGGAALGTAALAATAFVSISTPATGAATPEQWACAGAPGYAASVKTSTTAVRGTGQNNSTLTVTVATIPAGGTPTGTVEGATTQYTSASNPNPLVTATLASGSAALTFGNASKNKFVGYIPTGNFCASGTSTAQ